MAVLCERWRLVGPPASALRGLALNRPDAASAEDRRGERSGKRRGFDRVRGTRKTFQKRSAGGDLGRACAVEASKRLDGIEIEGPASSLEMSLAGARVLARRCPAWRRREPGLRLLHGT
jgi:hypothetical protein